MPGPHSLSGTPKTGGLKGFRTHRTSAPQGHFQQAGRFTILCAFFLFKLENYPLLAE
jgi:hypothetical protein